MSDSKDLIVLQVPEFGSMAFSLDECLEARQRARSALGLQVCTGNDIPAPSLCTSQQMEDSTGVPKSWWEEAARTGKVPSIQFGKYRRFDREDVIRTQRHAD